MITKSKLYADILVVGSGPSGFAAAYSAAKNGAKLTGTNRLRIKESDRGEAMKAELLKKMK